VLQCSYWSLGAVCCGVVQRDAVCCSALQCVVACCSVLQCVAVCCSVLQCVAVCCSVLSGPLYMTKTFNIRHLLCVCVRARASEGERLRETVCLSIDLSMR